MNFGVLSNILPFTSSSQNAKTTATTLVSKNTLTEKPEERSYFNINIWGWSIMSIVSWAIHQDVKRTTQPTPPHGVVGSSVTHPTVKQTTQPMSPHGGVGSLVTHPTIRFRPYVCKVPWHTGARAFLSQLFPRYGHYCGPNWSSGKDGGSLLWDKRPIDWLDFCCYCHDIGYDSHDQAELLRADMAFLQCLERPHMTTKGDPRVAHLYKTMCISGLRNILIPYRNHLVKLQSGQLSIGFGWVGNIKWKGWNPKNT